MPAAKDLPNIDEATLNLSDQFLGSGQTFSQGRIRKASRYRRRELSNQVIHIPPDVSQQGAVLGDIDDRLDIPPTSAARLPSLAAPITSIEPTRKEAAQNTQTGANIQTRLRRRSLRSRIDGIIGSVTSRLMPASMPAKSGRSRLITNLMAPSRPQQDQGHEERLRAAGARALGEKTTSLVKDQGADALVRNGQRWINGHRSQDSED